MEKSKIKYIIGISLLAVIILFFGYKKVWNANAEKVQNGTEKFLSSINVNYDEIKMGGFPFKITASITNANLTGNSPLIKNDIVASEIKMVSSLLAKKVNITLDNLVIKDNNKEIGQIKYNTKPKFLIEFNNSMKVKTLNYEDSGYVIVKTKTKQEINKSGATKLSVSINEENSVQYYEIKVDGKNIKAASIVPEEYGKNIFAEVNIRLEKNPEMNMPASINTDIKALEVDSTRYKLRLDGNYDVDFANLSLNTNLNVEVSKYQSIIEDINKKVEEQINFIQARQDLAANEKEQYVSYIKNAKESFFLEVEKVNTKNTKNTEDKKYFEIKTTEDGQYKVNNEDLMPLVQSLNRFLLIFG